MGSARLRGVVFCPGGSALWPQCWLWAVCAVGHVGCCVCVEGGVTCGGKHIIILIDLSKEEIGRDVGLESRREG